MGIKKLTQLIASKSPLAIKEKTISQYSSQIVAIDSYMLMYQFLIALRAQDGSSFTDHQGEDTMHLSGIFYRTIKFIESGILPLFVFDGQAPIMKSETLNKREEQRKKAEKSLENAKESGNIQEMAKFSKMNVKVEMKHVEEVKKLLKMMGVPYFEAPSEAEAQCAQFQKLGIADYVASEDLDTLTFGANILLRNFNAKDNKKNLIKEINLQIFLDHCQLSMDQFIDLCILLGCDYCKPIKNVGPKRAFDLIKKYGKIEKILENLDEKYSVESDWPYQQARDLFKYPNVNSDKTHNFQWIKPDENEIIKYLVNEKNFRHENIINGISKLKKAHSKPPQCRIDSFFKRKPAKLSKE